MKRFVGLRVLYTYSFAFDLVELESVHAFEAGSGA